MATLQTFTNADLNSILDSTRHEQEVNAHTALALIGKDEPLRLRLFIAASEEKRSLLVGVHSAQQFLSHFVFLENEETALLTKNGRCLDKVVATIQNDFGTLQAAAKSVPWLEKAVQLVNTLDFEMLANSNLLFVRRASAEEAKSCENQVGLCIEEGQHRAIAAAWLFASGRVKGQSIRYLRGVNRDDGYTFWRV